MHQGARENGSLFRENEKRDLEKRVQLLSIEGIALLEVAREMGDAVEGFVSDSHWLLPKYRELLFIS